MQLVLPFPEEAVDAIVDRAAERAAEIVVERFGLSPASPSPWLTPEEAAAFLRCKVQRIYDLRSSGRLTPYTEGGRAICAGNELEALVEVEDPRRRRAA